MSAGGHEGGCLCGGIRYRVDAVIDNVMHCHCGMCRRASGAVVVTWFTAPPERVSVTRGKLKTWRSSANFERGFCPDCGCQITFRDVRTSDRIGITVATLDDAARVPAGYHVEVASRLFWLHLDEHLPAWPHQVEPAAR